jgi:U3 small nucleolar RNA-associated protein MPP10
MPRRTRSKRSSTPRRRSTKPASASASASASLAAQDEQNISESPQQPQQMSVDESALAQAEENLGHLFENPHELAVPSQVHAKSLVCVTKVLHDLCKKHEPHDTGAMPELLIDGFDAEQVWEELQLQHVPMIRYLRRNVDKALAHGIPFGGSDEEESELEDAAAGTTAGSSQPHHDQSDLSSDSDDVANLSIDDSSGDDEDVVGVLGGADSDDDGEEDADMKTKASNDDEDNDDDDDSDQVFDDTNPENQVTEDMFFSMGGLEEFADFDFGDDAAELLVDEEEEEEIQNVMYGNGAKPLSGDVEPMTAPIPNASSDSAESVVERIRREAAHYNDFFDAPDTKPMGENNDQAQGNFEEEFVELASDKTGQSSFAKRQAKMQERIAELEQKIVKPRDWDMMGEVSAAQRPAESLLEQGLEFDFVSRMPPATTPESTESLETLIKRRIQDDIFDDPERKVLPKEKAFRPRMELSQEKSKQGLAELYEREYVQKVLQGSDATAADGTALEQELDDKLNKEHQEIATLVSNLFHELDTLTNFAFTPQQATDEVVIQSSAPAIQMEEIIPMGVSKAQAFAPQDVYRSKAQGVPSAPTEMTAEEKTGRRRKRKRQRRKRVAQEDAHEAAVAKAFPNSREARRIEDRKTREMLSGNQNVSGVKVISDPSVGGSGSGGIALGAGVTSAPEDTTKYSSSTDFFTKIQHNAYGAPSARTDPNRLLSTTGSGKRKRRKKDGSGKSRGGSFKL